MGKSKKDAVKPYYRARSEGPLKLKKTSTANTEMQIAVIIGVLGLRARPLLSGETYPVNHEARRHSD